MIPSARDLAVARAVQTAEERQGFYRLEDVIAAIPEPDPLPACQSCDLGDKWAECSCTDREPQPPVTRSDLAAVGAALANLRPPDPLPAPTGPGWWWARRLWNDSAKWSPVMVFDAREPGALSDSRWVNVIGCREPRGIEYFDAWLPLVPPGGAE